jgi:transketolase
MAHVLFSKFIKASPSNPEWMGRDRFVLSNGHACALLYSFLHLLGYDLPMDQLKAFRQLGSLTPGHPENVLTAGVEVSTGPLGQGISQAVGLAVAEKNLAATFNQEGHTIVDNYTYVICGDGCLQEGVSGEASSLAGHLGLGKLIVLYDDNKITIDGATDLSFTEDVGKRYEAYGWQVLTVEDGDGDLAAIAAAVEEAKADTSRPTIIKVATTIGFGSSKAGTSGVHGAPLGADDLGAVKSAFGFNPEESFVVPEDVSAFYGTVAEAGAEAEAAWNEAFAAYKAAHPELAAEFERRVARKVPEGLAEALPRWSSEDKAEATRSCSGKVLNALAKAMPEVMGGSADLTPSNKTLLACSGDFQAATPEGRYMRFGVREHAMCAITNGMAAYGAFLPFTGTFMNFVGYALGAVRVGALSHLQVLHVATHDSIGLGEDGPTHQPVEMLLSLRAMPNVMVFRPADGNETTGSYLAALAHTTGPSILAGSRQNLPQLAGSTPEAVARGAYTVWESTPGTPPALTLVASGSEVSLAIDCAKALDGVSVRVVSMPCEELFVKQSVEYRLETIPDGVPTVSIEASATRGWEAWSHVQVGMETFGVSAPGSDCYKHFGITVDAIVPKLRKTLEFYSSNPVPALLSRPQF